MTCIAGIVEHGTITIGGDSAGASTYLITIHHEPKVFYNHQNPQFLFGCTGSFRINPLLRFALVPPPCPPDREVEHYMSIDFVNAIRTSFTQDGFAKQEFGREEGGKFLVGYRGRLFCIDSDYQVHEPDGNYLAIGSADEVALGVLFATQDRGMPPRERITLALQASALHTKAVRPPFRIESIEAE